MASAITEVIIVDGGIVIHQVLFLFTQSRGRAECRNLLIIPQPGYAEAYSQKSGWKHARHSEPYEARSNSDLGF